MSENDAVNVKYVETLVGTVTECLTTLNELYNGLKTKNEEIVENTRKLMDEKKKVLSRYMQAITVLYVKMNFNFLLEEMKLKIQLQGF